MITLLVTEHTELYARDLEHTKSTPSLRISSKEPINMRLLQSLTTFFAGAALSGVASAAAVDTKLAARDSPFSDLGLDIDFWGALNNYCRNGIV
ncbi:hypothetical protein DL770_001394 [Monosporascus sp. CRB-9-2]|nr:hypothetical protein DL770_001394 [Monosporascus sp. CRB-9-2]